MRLACALIVCLMFVSALTAAPTRAAAARKKPSIQPIASPVSRTVRKPTVAAKTTSRGKAVPQRRVEYRIVRGRRVPVYVTTASRNVRRRPVYINPWTVPSYTDPTEGDDATGEDLLVRTAAVEALGTLNGSVVVADPQTGRVLTIVNQKLAFRPGFTPCSTIKIVTALASLQEGLIDRFTILRLGRRSTMDLTEALAISNNPFFAQLGERMGYEKVVHYARHYGLGEKAGYDIIGETAGPITDNPGRAGGVGMMTSFGNGFRVTPLQLVALTSAIANNGTLLYLQYPRTAEELANLQPRVKRQLDIEPFIPELKPGMFGAVEYGTGRRAGFAQEESLAGKTGTCTDWDSPGTHMGWFTTFNEFGRRKLAVSVMLTGGRAVNGPVASGVAGAFFRNLSRINYFEADQISSARPVPETSTSAAGILASVRNLFR